MVMISEKNLLNDNRHWFLSTRTSNYIISYIFNKKKKQQ